MLTLDSKARMPLYQQLYEQIRNKIISGEYGSGTNLPSTRSLARELCVGRNTVEAAYAQLNVEGYIQGRAGAGHTVLDVRNGFLPLLVNESAPDLEEPGGVELPVEQQATAREECTYDFQYGTLDASDFPLSLWKRLQAEVLHAQGAEAICGYGDPLGEGELRREIRAYLRESRGVSCSTERIVVCCGTQYALQLVAGLLPNGMRTLAMEEPGYDGSRVVFRNNGFAIAPVEVNRQGIDLGLLAASPARVVCVTPSHQFPTGVVMPIQHRAALLEWAVRRDALIIEDDYDSEYRYKSQPIPSLQSIDSQGRVIYLGTYSKALAPGLRISYMVLPGWLMQRFHEVYHRYKCPVSSVEQRTLALFMARGYWKRHLRRTCLKNKKKHDTLVRAIENRFGSRVTIHGSDAGLHILVQVKGGEEARLIELARQRGVRVYPVGQHWLTPGKCPGNIVLLGFSKMGEQDIEEGVRQLGEAWFG